MEDYLMKKAITLALILVLALSLLAACGSNDNGGSSTTTPPSSSTTTPPASQGETTAPSNNGDKAADSLIAWMMGGTFSYDFTMTTEGNGEKTESSGSMAMEGNNLAMTSEMTVEGQAMKSRIIIRDGTTYIIDDANKFIMKAAGGMNPTAGMMTDYSGIAKTGDGTGEINGRSLPYEEYTEGETGATVRYYLDGGQVYGIESEYEGYKTVMIITNPKNSVPANAFDLPEGYTQM
jgi:outer membrane lipoprotein-sorting protein